MESGNLREEGCAGGCGGGGAGRNLKRLGQEDGGFKDSLACAQHETKDEKVVQNELGWVGVRPERREAILVTCE